MKGWDELMEPPSGISGDGFDVVTVRLGEDTYNTCNPGVGDADGDGLDEVAVPVIDGDHCRISLYRGDGSEVWRNDDVAFFNYYYDDMEAHAGTHWHAKNRHRHLFTQVLDIDGDGRPEVVCGDGPMWVLDAQSGVLKKKIDLNAHVQAWCPAYLDGRDESPWFVGGVEARDGSGSGIVMAGSSLEVERLIAVEGRSFEDALWAGDIDHDGFDEVVFSPRTTQSMFLMDRRGEIRWSQKINGVIGDDTHVDDLVIDTIHPGPERQLLMATGPALLDERGRIEWALGDRYHHAQRVLAVPTGGEGKDVYFCESYDRACYLLDHIGRQLWHFDGFQKPRPDAVGVPIPRLTTAGGLADWFGTGMPLIVQSELCVDREGSLETGQPMVFYVHLLQRDGCQVAAIPLDDELDRWGGAMCARVGRFSRPNADDLVVITHSGSRMYFLRCGR